jgi:hypothetical protein
MKLLHQGYYLFGLELIVHSLKLGHFSEEALEMAIILISLLLDMCCILDNREQIHAL